MTDERTIIVIKMVASLGLYWSFDRLYILINNVLIPYSARDFVNDIQPIVGLAFSIVVLIIGIYKLRKIIREDKKDRDNSKRGD